MSNADEGLVKIVVELRDGPFERESFWAEPLGDDLFKLRNSPWFAFDLHFDDVVRAVAVCPGDLPRIVEVVRRSGHRTLRVIFSRETSEPERLELLRSLQ